MDTKRWDAVARSLCEKGIREKFVQNPQLMHVLLKKTANKMIVECANDRLWGNGKALSEESCLNRDMWISQGILGQILEDVRSEFAGNRFPVSSYPTVPGITGSLTGYLCPPPPPVPATYNSNPLHTMSLEPASFRPTQIPLMATATPPVQNQIAQPTTTPVVELTPTAPVNTGLQQPEHTLGGAQNLGVDNQSTSATTITSNSTSTAVAPPQTPEIMDADQPSAEEMDTRALTKSISTDNIK